MATVNKTWNFASDAEGLADQGDSGVTFSWQSADASVQFAQTTKSVTQTERARPSSITETWEDWGVPAGSTVTAVELLSYTERTSAVTKLSSHNLDVRIVGSGGGTVHSAGDLLTNETLDTDLEGSQQTGPITTAVQRAVDAGSQASTTAVGLELEYTVTTSGGGGGANVVQRFDAIVVQITYTATSPTRGLVSWAELEAPLVSTRGLVSWAELETPIAPTRGLVSWAELETPSAPADPTRGLVSWAELETPLVGTRGLIAWAELEAPLTPTRGRVSWAELEAPLVPTRGLTSWAEFEAPGAATRGLVSWAEFEVPDESGGGSECFSAFAGMSGALGWTDFGEGE